MPGRSICAAGAHGPADGAMRSRHTSGCIRKRIGEPLAYEFNRRGERERRSLLTRSSPPGKRWPPEFACDPSQLAGPFDRLDPRRPRWQRASFFEGNRRSFIQIVNRGMVAHSKIFREILEHSDRSRTGKQKAAPVETGPPLRCRLGRKVNSESWRSSGAQASFPRSCSSVAGANSAIGSRNFQGGRRHG